ncbi:MAG: hypothetical protein JSR82_13335 [Verrucomicrobia bacterium]|nr:hypothetical protein [Verrucomicrobiota bacterium]
MRFLSALVALALLGLTACESGRSVQRAVRIPARLPQEQVMAAIKDVPGTELARYRRLPSNIGYGRIEYQNYATDQYHFIAEGRRADGVIEVGGNDREGNRLRMYCVWASRNVPPQQIEATRQLLDDVYAALQRRLPTLVPPRERVQEEVR